MRSNSDEAVREVKLGPAAEAAPLHPAPALSPATEPAADPSRISLLKRPIADRPDALALLRTPPAGAQPQRWPGK